MKKHLENIYRKLRVKTRTAAALRALAECCTKQLGAFLPKAAQALESSGRKEQQSFPQALTFLLDLYSL